MLLKKRAASQPRHAPSIDWTNPLTRGLVGLLWAGDGKSRELIGTSQWPSESSVVKVGTPQGAGSRVTSTAGVGIGSARQSLETASTSSANWRLSAPPLSLLMFVDFDTPAGTRGIGGVAGNSSLGYGFQSLFATRTRGGNVNLGASGSRVLIDGSSHFTVAGDTTWYTGAKVRGYTVDANASLIYDDGKLRASTAGSSASILYDTTFGRTMLLSAPDYGGVTGTGYWMGVWTRALSAPEMAALSADPWQLFAPLPRRIWAPAVTTATGPALSALEAYSITPSTAKLRVTLTF